MSGELFMGGTRLWERDQAELAQLAAHTALQREQAANLRADNELNPLKGDLLRAQVAHQGTLADLNRAQADVLKQKEDREERVARAIAAAMGKPAAKPETDEEGNPVPGTGSEIDNLARLGTAAMAAGGYAEGEKLIKLAAELKQKQASTQASLASEALRKARTDVLRLQFMQEVFSGVTDPASHGRALMLLQGNPLTAGEKVPAGLRTYDPKMVAQFLAGSKVALEKRRTDIQAFNASSADAARQAAQATREYLAELTEQRTNAYVARQEHLTKAGVGGPDEKPVSAPNSAERRIMRETLAEEGIEFGEDDDEAVTQLAEQVKFLTTRNPSIQPAEARAKVIQEAIGGGDLDPGQKRWAFSKKAKYKPTEGSSVAMPLPLPTSKDALVVGKYYRDPESGQIAKFTGDKFEYVSKRVARPPKGK